MQPVDHSAYETATRSKHFHAMLDAVGLRVAMAGLLEPTNYRYIAIFRINEDRASAAFFYDREEPSVERVAEVPSGATYCSFAHKTGTPFVTADALIDDRLLQHPARDNVRAYHGVPILTPEGEILGTLCHYDHVPRNPDQVDLALMCEVASTLQQRGLVPPYPAASKADVPD